MCKIKLTLLKVASEVLNVRNFYWGVFRKIKNKNMAAAGTIFVRGWHLATCCNITSEMCIRRTGMKSASGTADFKAYNLVCEWRLLAVLALKTGSSYKSLCILL
jgi:hypothetical protein